MSGLWYRRLREVNGNDDFGRSRWPRAQRAVPIYGRTCTIDTSSGTTYNRRTARLGRARHRRSKGDPPWPLKNQLQRQNPSVSHGPSSPRLLLWCCVATPPCVRMTRRTESATPCSWGCGRRLWWLVSERPQRQLDRQRMPNASIRLRQLLLKNIKTAPTLPARVAHRLLQSANWPVPRRAKVARVYTKLEDGEAMTTVPPWNTS